MTAKSDNMEIVAAAIAAKKTAEERLFALENGVLQTAVEGETNLKEAGKVPAGYSFACAGIACQWYYEDNTPLFAFDANNSRNRSGQRKS